MSGKDKNANFKGLLSGSKPTSTEFDEIDVLSTFKPINPEASAKRVGDKVAVASAAAPGKRPVQTRTTPSLAELAASVEEASRQIKDDEAKPARNKLPVFADEEAKPARNKLPVYAAVAASLGCVAFLGFQSWPSATASTSTVAISSGDAIIAQPPAAPSVAAADFAETSSSVSEPTPIAPLQQPVLETADTVTAGMAISEPTELKQLTLPSVLDESPEPDASMQLAMAEPDAVEEEAVAEIVADPVASPQIEKTTDVDSAPTESSQVGTTKTASTDSDLSRTDCAALFKEVSRSGTINFGSGSAELLGTSTPILKFFKTAFDTCSEFTIAVEGHTDSSGKASSNQKLSEKRAESVAEKLVKMGVPSDNLHVIGYGESKPIASNDTAATRSQNRRIEFTIFDG